MTRTEARKIARQMVKSGDFHVVEIIEDVTHDEIRIEAMNRCWMRRTVQSELDWWGLRDREGRQ